MSEMANRAHTYERPYTRIQDSIITDFDLGPMAGWLYVVMKRYTSAGDETSFPSIATLAKEAGMSPNTVKKYTKVLVNKGLILVHKRKTEQGDNDSNLYIFRDPDLVRGVGRQLPNGGAPVAHEEEPSNNNQKTVPAKPVSEPPPAEKKSEKPKRKPVPARTLIVCKGSLGWKPTDDNDTPGKRLVIRANKVVAFLNESAPEVTNDNPAKLRAFYRWWRKNYKDANPPVDDTKFATHWQVFSRAYEAKHNPAPAQQAEAVSYDPTDGLDKWGLSA